MAAPPVTEPEVAAPVTPELEEASKRAEARRGFLIALPSFFYLVLLFVIPLGLVFVYSFATRDSTGLTVLEDWNLESYKRLFSADVLEIFVRSLVLAFLTTVICLVVCYPFAFYIATRTPRVRNILLILVMIPFWSNFLVRTYAWRVLLGSEGPLSQLSVLLGGEPFRLLFTNVAVLIGLVYGFMPFMVLPLYAALERMDWRLVEAARDLYADGWTAFRKVTLPLSMPGVVAGSILVFIPSLGAYVTPALLGGARTVLMGDYIVSQFLAARNWPFGSALSFAVMFVMLLATIFYFRAGGKDAVNEGTAPKGLVDRLLALNAWVVYLFFYAPIILLIVFSFNDNDNVGIWTQPSLRWYGEMLQDERVMGALRNSLIVAFFVTIVSTVLGTMLAIALERYRFRGRGTLDGIAYLPIIIPDVTMAVMLLIFFFQAFGMLEDALGLNLSAGLLTITLAHIAFCISFVAIVVRARLSQLDSSLEEAAADLYANRWQAFRRVTLPLIAPGVAGGALLALTLSLDDVVVTQFVSGAGSTTLPVYVFGLVRRGVTPLINAVSTVMLVASMVLVGISLGFQRGAEARGQRLADPEALLEEISAD